MIGASVGKREPRQRGHGTGLPTLLVLAMGIGPLTSYGITALSPLIVRDLRISRVELGMLATVCFSVAALTSLGAARATARLGSRAVLLAQFAAAAVAIAAVAGARSIAWLLVGIGISGFAQSLSNPATNDLVSRHVRVDRRGWIVGLKQSGVQMSQFVAGISLPGLAVVTGWRPAIAASGIVAAVGVVLTALCLTRRGGSARQDDVSRSEPNRRPRLPPEIRWMLAYTALMAAALQATNVYLPLFAYQRLHLSSGAAGVTVAVVGGVGLAARIFWGKASARAIDPRRIMLWMSGLSAGVLGLLILCQLSPFGWLVWPAAALDGATAIASNVVVIVCMIKWFGPNSISHASGVLAIGMYFGFAVGPLGFGAMVDAASGYTPAFMALALLYGAASLVVIRWRSLPLPVAYARPLGT